MLDRIRDIYDWTATQPNWVSALTHAGICGVVITLALGLEYVSYLVEPGNPIPFVSHAAVGMATAYTLRELDDARKAIGRPHEGRKLGEGYEDLIAAVVACVAFGVIYAGLF